MTKTFYIFNQTNMKKSSIILGSFMGLAIAATGVSAAAVVLKDVPADHWAKSAVDSLSAAGVVKGYDDGTFKGNNTITRYEVAVIVDKNNMAWTTKWTAMEKAMTDKMAAMEKSMTEMQTKMAAMEKMMNPMASVMYMATLDGKQEVPAVDTTATGTATLELKDGKVNYTVEVKDLSGAVTGAHIHMGEAGKKGDVVHTITFDGMKAVGSWTPTAQELKDLPNKMFYVNVHTAKNVDGEIRGQIVPKA